MLDQAVALRGSDFQRAVASFNSLASQRGVGMASLSLVKDKRGPYVILAGRLSSCTKREEPVRCRDTHIKYEGDWSYGSGQ